MSAIAHNPSGTDLIAPLVLLQLSDLHFGSHSRFAGCDLERLAAQCRQALDEARRDLGWVEAVGIVIVTGDIAEAAYPKEYATAVTFFRALARELALLLHRFVFVPGNHDISWTRCQAAEGELKDDYGGAAIPETELRARLDGVKFAHFEKFLRDVHGGKGLHEVDGAAVTSLAHGAFIHDFPDLGVSVAALNSCERESHRKEDHVGALSAAQAQAVLDHWKASSAELIRIAAVHHNPAEMASPAIKQWLEFLRASTAQPNAQLPVDLVDRIATNFVGFEGHEHLRHLTSDAHASLILHGHHHASTSHQAWAWRGRDPGGAGDTRIVSAGSWGLSPESGKLPKDQPVVMQLIRLDPAAAQLHAVLLTYDPTARLSGEVRLGRFLIDSQTRYDRPIGLSLPPALRGRYAAASTQERVPFVADASARARGPDLSAAMSAYRARKTGSFERWELRTAGPQPTVGNRPVEIALDDMYIPLRFGAELDPVNLVGDAPIQPGDLLQPRRPRVVVGSAGSGKTTWMRWTFRRLIREPRAIPFFLELRAIAAAWKTPQDAARSIDGYLADELAACGVSNVAAVVAALLADSSGAQPVILIDGWDELGAHGVRLRERLVEFCRAFPHVVVVVSSRPYGETRPAGAEGFETLRIQPLSDDDVRLLATHFHRQAHGLDEAAGARATDEFMVALAAAPDARSLASTALLLTMMLLLNREGPLPDRRHKLYSACLRNMLLHRVDQRERDGVMVDRDQWRPDDSEERLRVVAELAYRMQTEGYQRSDRAPIIRPWDAAVGLLRPEWSRDQRERFLRWLVASAGVLLGAAASWPDRGELALLRLWPSARGRASIRLQAALSLGAGSPEVRAMLPAVLGWDTRPWSSDDLALAQDFSRDLGEYFVHVHDFAPDFGRNFGRDFGRDFGRYFGRDFGRYFGRDFARDFARDIARELGRDFSRYFTRNLVRDLVRYFGRNIVRNFVRDFVRYFGRYFIRDFLRDLGFAESMLDRAWLPRFAMLELGSVMGRFSPRAALAYAKMLHAHETPVLALFRAACQASFSPGDARLLTETIRACDAFDGDPLWPALARHVARISTGEHRALLEDLARHPERREPPLSWGLQYYVRGDLMFDDDSVVTLDELCAQAGLAAPPLLEDMPDELDIPLDNTLD